MGSARAPTALRRQAKPAGVVNPSQQKPDCRKHGADTADDYPPSASLFRTQGSPNASFLRLLPQILRQSVVFGSVSGSVFVGLNVLFYRMYGQLFLHEAFLHHLTRKDPRHNFSVYFYHIYLTFVQPAASGVDSAAGAVAGGLDPGRLAFLPQFAAVLAFGWVFHRHLPFAWLLQTMAFVAFNKVR